MKLFNINIITEKQLEERIFHAMEMAYKLGMVLPQLKVDTGTETALNQIETTVDGKLEKEGDL